MNKKKPGPPKGQKLTKVKRTPIGMRLFTSRKARGLTQEQLGKMIGLSKRMVAHYESNVKQPPVEVLTEFATALKVTVSYLLGESVQKKITEELKPIYRKHVETLQSLPPNKQKHAIEMVEAWAATTQQKKPQ